MQHEPVRPASTVDLAAIIAAHPCAAEVEAVEVCVGAADRVWARCQVEVKALRSCNERKAATAKSQSLLPDTLSSATTPVPPPAPAVSQAQRS